MDIVIPVLVLVGVGGIIYAAMAPRPQKTPPAADAPLAAGDAAPTGEADGNGRN